jgi:hypothetical protein
MYPTVFNNLEWRSITGTKTEEKKIECIRLYLIIWNGAVLLAQKLKGKKSNVSDCI